MYTLIFSQHRSMYMLHKKICSIEGHHPTMNIIVTSGLPNVAMGMISVA